MAPRAPQPLIPIDPTLEQQWPEASGLAAAVFQNMGYLYSRVVARIEAISRRHGVPSMTAFNVLTILHGAGEPLLPSLIAERLIITRGTVTGVIDSLERHDLVRRTTHTRDGRMRLIAITPEGIERALRVRGELHREEKRLLSCLSEPQQHQLLSMVARLQANLDADA